MVGTWDLLFGHGWDTLKISAARSLGVCAVFVVLRIERHGGMEKFGVEEGGLSRASAFCIYACYGDTAIDRSTV